MSAGKRIFWMHDDCLRAEVVPAGVKAIYCFDTMWHRQQEFSSKRLAFLAESAQEAGAQLLAGDPVAAILAAAKAEGASSVVTVETVCPRVTALRLQMAKQLPVELLPDDGFVDTKGPLDLKRFSRYWQRVARRAMETD